MDTCHARQSSSVVIPTPVMIIHLPFGPPPDRALVHDGHCQPKPPAQPLALEHLGARSRTAAEDGRLGDTVCVYVFECVHVCQCVCVCRHALFHAKWPGIDLVPVYLRLLSQFLIYMLGDTTVLASTVHRLRGFPRPRTHRRHNRLSPLPTLYDPKTYPMFSSKRKGLPFHSNAGRLRQILVPV